MGRGHSVQCGDQIIMILSMASQRLLAAIDEYLEETLKKKRARTMKALFYARRYGVGQRQAGPGQGDVVSGYAQNYLINKRAWPRSQTAVTQNTPLKRWKPTVLNTKPAVAAQEIKKQLEAELKPWVELKSKAGSDLLASFVQSPAQEVDHQAPDRGRVRTSWDCHQAGNCGNQSCFGYTYRASRQGR